jgi:hypothetical protein
LAYFPAIEKESYKTSVKGSACKGTAWLVVPIIWDSSGMRWETVPDKKSLSQGSKMSLGSAFLSMLSMEYPILKSLSGAPKTSMRLSAAHGGWMQALREASQMPNSADWIRDAAKDTFFVVNFFLNPFNARKRAAS